MIIELGRKGAPRYGLLISRRVVLHIITKMSRYISSHEESNARQGAWKQPQQFANKQGCERRRTGHPEPEGAGCDPIRHQCGRRRDPYAKRAMRSKAV